MSRTLRFTLLLAAVASLAGCERPFVPIDPPVITLVGPDLSEVTTDERLTLTLRVTALRPLARVTVNGRPATATQEGDHYRATLDLAPGLNTFAIEAEDVEGTATRDTAYALRLSLQTGLLPTAALPEARALHAATGLSNGAVLVSAGVGPDGEARADLYRLREVTPFTFTVEAIGALAAARAGHTASALPDGRILVLGGATRAAPRSAEDFVEIAEIVDPTSGTSTPLAARGPAIRRSGHAAFVLPSGGRTFVYVVGGRAPLGEGTGTPSTVVIAEVRSSTAGDSLVALTPAGGAGVLSPVTAPAAAFLPPRGGHLRGLVTGLYAPNAEPVTSRLVFLPGSGLYPFQILEERPATPAAPRDDAAVVALGQGLALLLGGRTGTDDVSSQLDVFADAAGRFFRVPPDRAALRTARSGHTATLLPSSRTVVVGGFTAPGTPTATSEVVFSD